VGEVAGAHGLEGALKVRPLTDFPDHLRALGAVMVEIAGDDIGVRRVEWAKIAGQRAIMKIAKIAGQRAIMKIEGVENREQAQTLLGARLKIRRSTAAPLPPGHYYVPDIVGLRVMTSDGNDLGEVTEVIRAPANDVYVTPRAMIPAVKEVVHEIDLERRVIVVEPIPGLAEE